MAEVHRFSTLNIAAGVACHASEAFLDSRAEKTILKSLPFHTNENQASGTMLVLPLEDNWIATFSVG